MKYKILTGIWAIVILVTMAMPSVGGPEVPFVAEAVHFGEFFVLGLLLAKSFDRPYFLAGGFLYGILVESMQFSIPGRMFSFGDMTINIVGLVFGFFLVKYCYLKKGHLKFFT